MCHPLQLQNVQLVGYYLLHSLSTTSAQKLLIMQLKNELLNLFFPVTEIHCTACSFSFHLIHCYFCIDYCTGIQKQNLQLIRPAVSGKTNDNYKFKKPITVRNHYPSLTNKIDFPVKYNFRKAP